MRRVGEGGVAGDDVACGDSPASRLRVIGTRGIVLILEHADVLISGGDIELTINRRHQSGLAYSRHDHSSL